MIGGELFERFLEESPICVMERVLLENVFAPDKLDAVFRAAAVRQYERELERQTTELARLAAIVQSSGDAIVGMTFDGTIASWNSGAERIYGYTPAEAIGRPVSILSVSHQNEEMQVIIDRVRQSRQIFPQARSGATGRGSISPAAFGCLTPAMARSLPRPRTT